MEQKKRSPWIGFIIFVIICAILVSPMVFSGELLKAKQVASIQQYLGDDFLYGAAYSSLFSHYKFEMISRRKAPVLVIGDSRMLQFKGAFFKDKNSFYNAGLIASTPEAFVSVLKHMPKEALPKTLIFGIDHSSLTKTGVEINPFNTPAFLEPEEYMSMNMLTRKMAEDLNAKRYTLRQAMSNPKKVGISAKIKEFGFKQDGSYYYGEIYKSGQTANERIEPYLERIRKGEDWFCGADEIYKDTLEKYEEIAEFCKDNSIHLIAVAPPLAPTGYKEYASRPDTAFLNDINSVVAPVFTSRGFEFYDYTNPQDLNLTDEYFIDAFHGSDVAYLRMTADMLKKGSALNDYASIEQLEEMENNKVSELVLQEGL